MCDDVHHLWICLVKLQTVPFSWKKLSSLRNEGVSSLQFPDAISAHILQDQRTNHSAEHNDSRGLD